MVLAHEKWRNLVNFEKKTSMVLREGGGGGVERQIMGYAYKKLRILDNF